MKIIYRTIIFCAVFALAAIQPTSASSSFETAVITLEFPGGAENAGLGETGVSSANTIYSVFYNPANAASLYQETYANLIYGRSFEFLLPDLGFSDLYHTYNSFAFSINNFLPKIDFGYTYSNNYLNFGMNEYTDETGRVIKMFFSSERVQGHYLAMKFDSLWSAGIALKYYNSQFAPGMSPIDPAIGTAK